MRSLSVVCTLALGIVLLPHSAHGQATVDLDALLQSLGFDAVNLEPECLETPPRAESFTVAAVFANDPAIFPDSAGFPAEFCPSDAMFAGSANGKGKSALGDLVWQERFCALAGGRLVAEGQLGFAVGDTLPWEAVVWLDTVPPPVPHATFSGLFVLKPGTGRFAVTTGAANMVAVQLGDAVQGRRAGSTAVIVCGWVANGRPTNR